MKGISWFCVLAGTHACFLVGQHLYNPRKDISMPIAISIGSITGTAVTLLIFRKEIG